MNAIVKVERPHLLQVMAEKYQLEPDQFSKTVRATCGMPQATAEQVAAFLIVAKTYNLNPVLREIWAFPSRSGGIVPIVSIDGWVNLVNSHPQCDGFEFEMHHDEQNGLIACTCKMHRKDRKYPVTVTEYLEECKRPTDPWKMAHRMLRHKAMIQAARYAFGFAGIYDEDEARTIAQAEPMRDVTPPRVPSPSEVEASQPEGEHGSDKYRPGDVVTVKPDDPITTGPQPEPEKPKPRSKLKWPDPQKDSEKWIKTAFACINKIEDAGALETFLQVELQPFEKQIFPPDWAEVIDYYDRRQRQLKGDEDG
jgi:phage recombination protein Bet